MTALQRLATVGAAVAAGLAGWGPLGAAPSAGSDYTGAAACRGCHSDVYESWQQTAHARATTSRTTRADSSPARCRGCHTTGDGPGQQRLPGVQCEACHGPGVGYSPDDIMRNPVLASALGLVDLSTPERRQAVCGACHRATTRIRRFDVEAAWRRIQHGSKR